MIRFIILVIAVAMEFIIGVPLMLIGYVIGWFSVDGRNTFVRGVLKVYFAIINFLSGVQAEFIGTENIPKDGSVLFVANHCSFFDVFLTYPLLPRRTGFIAKKEFQKIPIMAQLTRMIYSEFLDRKDIKQGMKVILRCIDKIKSGISVFVFPEGTRTKDGNMAEFKEGTMKISTKTGCPIVPVAITNTSAVFEDYFPKVTPQKVIIEFLKPIDPSDYDKDEQKHLGKLTHDLILEARDKNFEKINNISI